MDGTMIVTLAAAVAAIIYAAVLLRRRRAQTAKPQRIRVDPVQKAPTEIDEVRAVELLRGLGFFQSEPVGTDEELARHLIQRIETEWGAPIAELARTPMQLDVLIALLDPSRAYRAPSKYFYPGDDSFLEIVAACGRLDGIAALRPLREEWAKSDGPVDVLFSLSGEEFSYRVSDPKYIDVGLIAALNVAAQGGERRLRVSDALGMPDVVLALSDEEADMLKRERSWIFHPAAE